MPAKCSACRDGKSFATPFSMAFQPIVDCRSGAVFAHEALVRGRNGEPAGAILGLIDAGNRYAFDQQCRVKAIGLASRLFLPDHATALSINFMPNAVYEPLACIRVTLEEARRTGFPLDRIIFEFTEHEKIDVDHTIRILQTYRDIGFRTAIDDFGAGYSGLSLLARFQPDLVKIDMDLIRDIDRDRAKQVIVRRSLDILEDMGITPICEGIETAAEMAVLADMGVILMQGYHFARPTFEGLSPITPRYAA